MDGSGIDFSDCDLSGFDFTGANLTGCTFERARIAGTIFDQAQVDRRTLRRAADWPEHLQRWRLPERQQPSGAHLPDLAIFGDAPWCPELVMLPAGEFLMGSPAGEEGRYDSEGPQHRVRIDAGFALGRYPVTFEEYDHFCAMTKRERLGDEGWGRGRRPVINVSWWDAVAYCEWLSRETGQPYRLPSEAEWEYGCRAGTTTRYSWGDAITPKQANYDQSKHGKTTEVGGYPANPWGLYDMHGNVWEWVGDVWHGTYQGAPTDGSAWTDNEGIYSSRDRVDRGGSWDSISWFLRSAFRSGIFPGDRVDYLGFRVARTLH
ncbi:MAG: SUMF1/EgtB/PvdO family nonheme iron enzyme [Rhodospirillales bacterium]|nr:SUMF1/EgtB/PvdO family nonheme iron enzyme [Rhodospirillales bacterium]